MDFLMSVYHMPYADAALFPLRTAELLSRHRAAARGGDAGPDHPMMSAIIGARRRVRRYYETHFRILK